MSTKNNHGIGDRLGDLLKVYGLNASSLSSEVGGTTAKYYKLLNGKSKPDFETIYAILNRFPDISAEWFMRGEGPMKKSDLISKEEAESLIAENKAVKQMYRDEVLKLALPGKTKGVSNHPQVDREGASKLLTSISKKNIQISNLYMLKNIVQANRAN